MSAKDVSIARKASGQPAGSRVWGHSEHEEQESENTNIANRHWLPTATWPVVSIVWILIGIVILRGGFDWYTITAAYTITQIVTTVGYGAHTPVSQCGKLFVTAYTFMTILLLGALLAEVMEKIVRRTKELAVGRQIGKSDNVRTRDGDGFAVFGKCIQALGIFVFFLASGTAYFATVEACSCSYGIDVVPGCVESSCTATGGYIKTWIDCFYMTIVTMTTLGLGDLQPVSYVGRIFFIPWVICSSLATANLAGQFGVAFRRCLDEHVEIKLGKVMSRRVFARITKSTPGRLTKNEFRSFALLKLDMVKQQDLTIIDELFRAIDLNGDGNVSLDELECHFDKRKRGTDDASVL